MPLNDLYSTANRELPTKSSVKNIHNMMGDEELRSDNVPSTIALNVPLFLRKLWKMVNDESAQDIISWNATGDAFVIHDQLQFISALLPQYFRHNNMASFVRQLNFYDFHKIANIDKDEIQFAHVYFLKNFPQTLPLIKRKCTQTTRVRRDTESLTEILNLIKEIKSKHDAVNTELRKMQEENTSLWDELNVLRLRYCKQSKIINKLIHFLITYMQSRTIASKRPRIGTKKTNAKRLKSGPKLLEIDYQENKVHDFDDDDEEEEEEVNIIEDFYTVSEPGETDSVVRYREDSSDNQNESAKTSLSNKSTTSLPQPCSSSSNVMTSNHQQILPTSSIGGLISTSTSRNLSATPQSGTDSSKIVQQIMPENASHAVKYQPKITISPTNTNNVISSSAPSTSTVFSLNTAPTYEISHNQQQTVPFKLSRNSKEDLGIYMDNVQAKIESIQGMIQNLTPADFENLIDILQDNDNMEEQIDLENESKEYDVSLADATNASQQESDTSVGIDESLFRQYISGNIKEAVPIKKEIEEELEKELAGIEVLSKLQPKVTASTSAVLPVLHSTDSANTSNSSDDVSNIIENLISQTSTTKVTNNIAAKSELEKELAEIVAVANTSLHDNRSNLPKNYKSNFSVKKSKKSFK